MTHKSLGRVVLVGWDGGTFSVLRPLMEAGFMPHLRRFCDQGAQGCLKSTPHPLTPPAWTSMITGRTPGHHGVFDFVKVEKDSEHPWDSRGTSDDVRVETVWAIANRHGRRVTTLNFPYMYPPPAIDGF